MKNNDHNDYYEKKSQQRHKHLRVLAYVIAIILIITGICFVFSL